MKKIEKFAKIIEEKIKLKCQSYQINTEIIEYRIVGDAIIVKIPSYHVYYSKIKFNGDKKNDIIVSLEISDYLDDGIKSLFKYDKPKNLFVSDEDYFSDED
jgi:hypothetical protein